MIFNLYLVCMPDIDTIFWGHVLRGRVSRNSDISPPTADGTCHVLRGRVS